MTAAFDQHAWERHLRLPDGRAVDIRPIRPEDGQLYAPFMARETAEDLRFRFFGPVKQLSRAAIARFTNLDYAKAMAFIALDAATGEMLGVARLHDRRDGRSGEYAIVVRSDLKGRGLGWELMQLLIAYARDKGLRAIEGQVLHENTTMLKMCKQLGFEITGVPGAASVAAVKLEL